MALQGGLGHGGYHPVPSAQPAKLNCSGVSVVDGQATTVDIAYWQVSQCPGRGWGGRRGGHCAALRVAVFSAARPLTMQTTISGKLVTCRGGSGREGREGGGGAGLLLRERYDSYTAFGGDRDPPRGWFSIFLGVFLYEYVWRFLACWRNDSCCVVFLRIPFPFFFFFFRKCPATRAGSALTRL